MQSKRILIFDECPFARVCSALLHIGGFETETISAVGDVLSARDIGRFGLIITSYPFCVPRVEEIKKCDVSTIVLSDDIDESLLAILNDFSDSYCMMKPLDYEKFRSLVGLVMGREKTTHGGSHYFV